MTNPRILIVDDEPSIRKLVRMGLATQDFDVSEAPTAAAALKALESKPDLMILDLGLPDRSGFEVLRTVRDRGDALPIVILSSREDEDGKVKALDSGADDYITKPFSMQELLARVRTALRHSLQVKGQRSIFEVEQLSVDLVRRIVKVAGVDVKLTPKEYDLLALFVQHAGKVLTHAFLLHTLWDSVVDTQYLRVYVRALRQKIEPHPERPTYILTETGVGYRLKTQSDVP